MRTVLHPASPVVLGGSWLAAITGLGSALVLACVGQGLGALAGGCGWIGASLPIHRQVWALVNQPVLNFSSLPVAGGYWLGSLVVPLVVALLLLGVRGRHGTLYGQLTIVHTVWWIALVAGAWLPLLDPDDGHVARWLLLHQLPSGLAWLAPAIASVLALGAVVRLLAVARGNQWPVSRGWRILIVILHLVAPACAWLGIVYLVGGELPLRAAFGLLLPITGGLLFAWFGFPLPFPYSLSTPSRTGGVVLLSAAILTTAILWVLGRPIGPDRVSAVLWKTPSSFNNVRPWIEPRGQTSAPEAEPPP